MSLKTEETVPGEDTPDIVQLHRATSMVDSDVTKQSQTEEPRPSVLAIIKSLKIELIMFCYMFASSMRQVSSTTMIMDKVCLVHLSQPVDVCQNLSNFTDLKALVEQMANNYGVGHTMLQLLPSSILACFLGAWSDKYGRKLPLIVAMIGLILDGIGTTVCGAILYSRVEYYFIPAAFTGFSGGIISVLTILYSFAADTTTFANRTLKYALLEGAFGLSMPIGQAAGGWLFNFFGYVPVFFVSTVAHTFCLVFVVFVLKETKGLDNHDSWSVKLRHLWSFKPVVESFRATVKTRPNKGKQQVILLIIAMSIGVLSYSTGAIGYLYVHHVYNWGNTKYSTVSAVFSVISVLCMCIAVPVFRKLKLGDTILGIVGSSSLLAKNIALALAFKMEIYFLAHLLGILGGMSQLAGRSRISKVIAKEDTGKVFAFLSTAESLLPIAAVAVVSQIFNATLKFYPGAVYLGISITLLGPLTIFLWLSRIPSVNYEEIIHNSLENGDKSEKETVPEKVEC